MLVDRFGGEVRSIAVIVLCLMSTVRAFASPITVAGFEFAAGEQAFADDAFLVSGVIRTGNSVTGSCCTVAEVLSGSDLIHIVNNDTGNAGIAEVRFVDNAIVNGPGADLVIFELSGPLPTGTPDPRERFGVSIFDGSGFTAFSYVDPVATGFPSGGDPTLAAFAAALDLTDFGIPAGAFVDRVRLDVYDVGQGTKSADIAALGALNSLPEPSTGMLLASGLPFLKAVRRRLRGVSAPSTPPASVCRSSRCR